VAGVDTVNVVAEIALPKPTICAKEALGDLVQIADLWRSARTAKKEPSMKKHVSLLEQFDPMYGYDENGRWRGMTKDEVTVWLEQHRRKMDYLRQLRRFDHLQSLPN
jgi:hypothetical protein